MDPSSAVTSSSFSAIHLFLHADWVVKGVLIGLACASLWSWAVIIDKVVRLGAINRDANKFEDEVGSGKALEDVADDAGERPKHALPRMLQAALREWREARAKGLLTPGEGDAQAAFLVQRIDRVLDSVVARESQRVEEGLGSLAIVATASPFIGLFGTVWGIMNAFEQIGVTGSTSLQAVGTPIAEALIATAAGLAAAIPAVLFYNYLSGRTKLFASEMDDFAMEFLNICERNFT